MKTTVAIVGNGRTRVHAPHDNEFIEVWAMNNHPFLWQRRITGLFELHQDVMTLPRYSDEYKDWLRQPHSFPIWMHQHHPEIPSSEALPKLDLLVFSVFLSKGDKPIHDFKTSTFPYCLAMAYYSGFSRILMYGVDLEREERIQHRDAVFYWMGLLGARGIQIVIPEETELMKEESYPCRS